MAIKNRDLLCLQRQLGVTKEELRKAVAAVGTNRDDIEYYLQQQKRSNFVQWLQQVPGTNLTAFNLS